MRHRIWMIGLLAVAAGVMAGCGGGAAGATGMPYEGEWAGTWDLDLGPLSTDSRIPAPAGTAQISVAENGAIEGTVVDTTTEPDTNGEFSGFISTNGHVEGDLDMDYFSEPMSGSGTWEIDEDGHIVGSFNTQDGNYNFDFAPVEP